MLLTIILVGIVGGFFYRFGPYILLFLMWQYRSSLIYIIIAFFMILSLMNRGIYDTVYDLLQGFFLPFYGIWWFICNYVSVAIAIAGFFVIGFWMKSHEDKE